MTLYLRPIESAPVEQEVMLYWEYFDHMENGMVMDPEDGGMGHVLDGGASMTTEPTHWCPVPDKIFEELCV